MFVAVTLLSVDAERPRLHVKLLGRFGIVESTQTGGITSQTTHSFMGRQEENCNMTEYPIGRCLSGDGIEAYRTFQCPCDFQHGICKAHDWPGNRLDCAHVNEWRFIPIDAGKQGGASSMNDVPNPNVGTKPTPFPSEIVRARAEAGEEQAAGIGNSLPPCECERCQLVLDTMAKRLLQLEAEWAYHLHRWCKHLVWQHDPNAGGRWQVFASSLSSAQWNKQDPTWWQYCPLCGKARP